MISTSCAFTVWVNVADQKKKKVQADINIYFTSKKATFCETWWIYALYQSIPKLILASYRKIWKIQFSTVRKRKTEPKKNSSVLIPQWCSLWCNKLITKTKPLSSNYGDHICWVSILAMWQWTPMLSEKKVILRILFSTYFWITRGCELRKVRRCDNKAQWKQCGVRKYIYTMSFN